MTINWSSGTLTNPTDTVYQSGGTIDLTGDNDEVSQATIDLINGNDTIIADGGRLFDITISGPIGPGASLNLEVGGVAAGSLDVESNDITVTSLHQNAAYAMNTFLDTDGGLITFDMTSSQQAIILSDHNATLAYSNLAFLQDSGGVSFNDGFGSDGVNLPSGTDPWDATMGHLATLRIDNLDPLKDVQLTQTSLTLDYVNGSSTTLDNVFANDPGFFNAEQTASGSLYLSESPFPHGGTTVPVNPPLMPPSDPPDPPNFTVGDQTTDQTTAASGAAYTGPVAGLTNDLIMITHDNLNVVSSLNDVFIHTGSGSDAIDLSKSTGTNVMDGGTGSNFLTGGSGANTFFVDDRGPSSDIWSTVNGFHTGDAATVWGVTPQDFGLAWANGQGAAGYTGLTLHATASGAPTASLTLAGYTSADLSDGRLSVMFGNDPASGSSYMYVHGN